MSWNATNWPAAMVNLSDEVRAKAIEFANKSLARGYGAARALSTGITMAREWRSGLLLRRRGGAAFRVKPTLHGWEIRRSGWPDIHYRFGRRDDALRRAQELVRRRHTACVLLDEHGAVVERFDFGPAGAQGHAERTVPPAEAKTTDAPAAQAEPAPEVQAEPEPEVRAEREVQSEPDPVAQAEPDVLAEPEPEVLAEAEPERLEVRKGEDGWIIASGDAVLATHGTKRAALDEARVHAKAQGLSLAIYKTSGELQKIEDHG